VIDVPSSPDSSFRQRPLLALFPPVGTADAAPSSRPVQTHATPARDHERAFGLTEAPFAAHADPRFLFPSAEHERATNALLEAVRRRDGVVIVTGAPGCGKTLLSRTILERMDRRTLTSIVADPVRTIEELLSIVLAGFGVISSVALWRANEAGRREKLETALHDFLFSLTPLQAFGVLWIDDIDRFAPALLRELVAVIGGHVKEHRLQLVLVGDNGVDHTLGLFDVDTLAGGVPSRVTVGPLSADEITPYVLHRLDVAGSSRHVSFDDAAAARVRALTGGVPASVNALCDRALEIGHAEGVAELDAAVLEQAAEQLGLGTGTRRRWTDAVIVLLVIVVFSAAGGSAAALLFRQRVAQLLHPTAHSDTGMRGHPPASNTPTR
jgi:general secretion pathway protein A